MATSTTKLGLTKPALTDNVDVTVLNTNFDDIDTAAGFAIVTSATRPATPWTGQIIYETDTESSFVWDGSAWQSAGGGGGSIEISATAPSSPSSGDLWWDSDNGNLYIYYDDGDSEQWVAANGPQVFVGTAAPAGYQGQLWFDSTEGKTYIYYDDGSSAQWVSAIGGSLAGNVIQVVSTTKTDTFALTNTSFTEVTGLTASITPSSTSSKILVMASVVGQRSLANNDVGQFTIFKDSTNLIVPTSPGSRSPSFSSGVQMGDTNGSSNMEVYSFSIVDSPSTTSSITYAIRARNGGASEATYVNRSELDTDTQAIGRGVSTITLMEIAG